MEVRKAIEKAKNLIDHDMVYNCTRNYRNFEEFIPGYFITNENINSYMSLVSYNDKYTALTVLSGGDYVFSLLSKGISKIDAFDLNELQNYLALGLKRAMILKYNYSDFIEILFKLCSRKMTLEELSTTIFELLPFMDGDYQLFWKSIIDYNFKVQKQKGKCSKIDLMAIFSYPARDFETKIKKKDLKKLPYLKSKRNYDYLRNLLGNANITYQNINAKDLGTIYAGNTYDFIFLSNILDYFKNY